MIAGIAAGCAFALLVVWCVIDYARPLMYRGSGLGAVSLVLTLLMAAEIAGQAHFPGYQNDLNTAWGWALKLAHSGASDFYPPGYGYTCEHAPAANYLPWLSGTIAARLHFSWQQLRLSLEFPQLVMSFALALTLFVFLQRAGLARSQCWLGAMLLALNPAMIFDSVVWGQNDALVTLLMWLMVLTMIEDRYELAAALAATAVLTKPHAILLMPMLALWALRYARPVRWFTAAVSFAAMVTILVAPFQAGRSWDWLPRFYFSSLAMFRETSVNAFNFMALIGGLRQSETAGFMGLTYFQIGMALSACVLLFSLYLVWAGGRRAPMLPAFIALFGNFMFAPRMHERYFYPALIFFVPAAVEQPFMMAIYVGLSLGALFNIDYVLNVLRTSGNLAVHDPAAMAASAFNLVMFTATVTYAVVQKSPGEIVAHRLSDVSS